jgi:hypothetical protein
VDQLGAQPPEVMQSGHRNDGGNLTRIETRYGSRVGILALVVVVAAIGLSLRHQGAVERQRAGAVRVAVDAPLPFSSYAGAAEGVLRLRNEGPRALSVLTLDVESGGLRLVTENLPLRVAADGAQMVGVRFEFDCAVGHPRSTPGSVIMRARTADAREGARAVRIDALPPILMKLRHHACEPPLVRLAGTARARTLGR